MKSLPRAAKPPLLGVAGPATGYRAVQPRPVLRAARNARGGVAGRARPCALRLPGHPADRGGLRAPASRQPRRRAGAVAARDLLPRALPRGCMNVDVDRLIAATDRCIDELERVGISRFDR